jgi:hypothetical protein
MNTGDQPILAFDRIQPGDGVFDPYARNGAYVTGRSDGTVEIAMRAFPVPKGTEGDQAYEFTATRLTPGASTGGNLIVLLPFRYRPASTAKGGGDPLPRQSSARGLLPGCHAASSNLASRSVDQEHPVLPHNQEVVDARTLLCG